MRNIDIIYNLMRECRRANSIDARANMICEMEETDLYELCEKKENAYADKMRKSILTVSTLLALLTEDYKQRLGKTEFCVDEFSADAERIAMEPAILCEEWEAMIEQIWSLDAYCEAEMKSYLQMTQECYQHEFEPVRVVITKEQLY